MPRFSLGKLSSSQRSGYDKLDNAGKAAFRNAFGTASTQQASRLKPSYYSNGARNAYSSGSGEGNS